jgi:hypothetical protein
MQWKLGVGVVGQEVGAALRRRDGAVESKPVDRQ